ncbi:hypothetical protein D9613_008939 [Agrocybe pediades]|uniref:DUF6533 domain-containing protein n=1 Tax=Agrocybe pediades TaxID=84607 RepID=A0A8H4QUA9_9AGAR|nr:hypothetical protein D9613_008939 [Agrocybe pediades]
MESSYLERLAFRKYVTLAAWIVVVYEYASTLRREVKYIWRYDLIPPSASVDVELGCAVIIIRKRFNVVLGVYLFSKYLALVVQSINVYLVFGPLSRTDIPEQTCRKWFLFQMVVTASLLAAFDFILMLRVYALYRKSWRIGSFLLVLFISMVPFNVFVSPKAVYNVPFDPICEAQGMDDSVLYFGIMFWVIHISIVILTVAKWRLGDLGSPIIKLVTREGTLVLSLLCVLCAVMVSYAMSTNTERSDFAFRYDFDSVSCWPITFLSIGCCRLIMNMQALSHQYNLQADLTSFIESEIVFRTVTVEEEGLGSSIHRQQAPEHELHSRAR